MDSISTWDVEAWSVTTKCVFGFKNGSVKTVDVLNVFRSLETSDHCGQSLVKCSSLNIRHGQRGFLAKVEELDYFS